MQGESEGKNFYDIQEVGEPFGMMTFDQAIVRAGQLCPRGGFVVVKVAKPQQDMRFDVPTVGVQTIETMHHAGARVLAIEAGKTIILDEAQTVAAADRWGITILARAA